MVYLDSSLSSDPTRQRAVQPGADGWRRLDVYPHAVGWCNRPDRLAGWPETLSIHRPAGPLQVSLGAENELDLVLDFGTELEGTFHFDLTTTGDGNLALSFGESLWEAREWGPQSICWDQRPRKTLHRIASAGTHAIAGEQGGFRFVRIRMVDFRAPVTLSNIGVEALFVGERQIGDFVCSDPRLQRIWQASAYTARVCTRPDAYWDGIKRDRLGWYGDARITQETWDLTFHQPEPAEQMLLKLEANSWANEIPNYSFDALAMFKNMLLRHGTKVPVVIEIWERCQDLMMWVLGSQVDGDGLITRRDDVKYFFGIGFTDWTPQPLGGRLEEWGPLQFAWLECVNHAAQIAAWLGDAEAVTLYSRIASALQKGLRRRFRTESGSFHHTLNLAVPPETPWRMPLEGNVHYEKSYKENARFGPSGPSLQSAAMAVLSGVATAEDSAALLSEAFHNPRLPQIITSYYYYYVAEAQARCGDVAGALGRLKDFFGPMLEKYDSATVWESYEPEVEGIGALSLNAWPKSLCHGWGSCTVPWVARWLAGVEVLEPGFAKVRIRPARELGISFSLTIPTPHGDLKVSESGAEVPVGVQRVE